MDGKTQELLWILLWTCDTLSHPTWRNLTDSFEGWAYRNGFLRQIQRLQQQKIIEQAPGDRLYRLTEAGRTRALGGVDPVARWSRRWDSFWRLVLFDVPEIRNAARDKLRRYLRGRGFGYLQRSVWITPDPVNEERVLLADGPVNVKSLILLESHPCAGESDGQIVAGSWDFADINRRYAAHEKVLRRRPRRKIVRPEDAEAFHRWLRDEQDAWCGAMGRDPLLPESLLPDDYSGRKAWARRLEAMTEAGDQMRAFQGARPLRQ